MKNNFLIVANWKCNPSSPDGAEVILNSIKKKLKEKVNSDIVICPPSVYIDSFRKVISKQKKAKFRLGAQNCFWEKSGAFTGEISPEMLKNLNCQYVILGHSERRKYFGETEEEILKKLKLALKTGLKPILCIGETEEERKDNLVFEVLDKQIKETVGRLSSQVTNLVIAYEPVWAIGTGTNCSPNEAMTVLMFIKKELLKNFSQSTVERIKILYGGSVNVNNAQDYIEGGFDGLLVGGVSLKPGEFAKIIENIDNKKNDDKKCKR